ncbi:MAG: penicillin-binding transpeptidase domain-containing protein [Clostridia bacterium]
MNKRYTAVKVILALCAVLIFGRLIKLQLVDGAQYRATSDRRTTKSVVLQAPRGEFYDRYGRAIVTNRSGYSVQIQKQRDMDEENFNRLIYNLCFVFNRWNQPKNAEMPVSYDGEDFKFTCSEDEERLWKESRGFDVSMTAAQIMAELSERYSLGDYTGSNLVNLAEVRLDMEERGFSASVPYAFGTDVSIDVVTAIKEQSASFGGASVIVQPVRDYALPGIATHILGRVGNISREEYDEKKSEGYTINSMIGKQGLEKYLEKYLRGQDGLIAVDQTTGGGSIDSATEKPAVNGRNVTLTIDIELQKTCEEALRETITSVAANAGSDENGASCNAGAVVVMDVNSGEILAMASYPTYNIEEFNSNYAYLTENPAKPLINRAIMGTYTPGSTFKPCIAFAALQEGAITVDEEIEDTGKYTYYKDYQPGCWLYNQKGETHGYENVSEAIRDSCNVFFFETGRRLGIDKIVEYSKKFGFGSKTGIELAQEESSGSIASPQSREKRGGTWYPGDVLQTAIGQSDTLVTPLQLASYTATIANGGIRYKAHLVKSIQGTDTQDEIVYKAEELSRVEMSPEAYKAVTEGMRMVVTSGTAMAAFEGCTTSVAAKTGSAQISDTLTNGIYICYAPYENPQIAVACVLEKSGGGSKAAPVVRAVIDKYFSSDEEYEEYGANVLKP